MKNKNRIQPSDTVKDVIIRMSDGNPGAISVMGRLFQQAPGIDPRNVMAELWPLMWMDSLGIYGPDIWVLYKYCCNENLVSMMAVLRAAQFRFISEDTIRDAIKSSRPLPVDDLLAQVTEQLEGHFGEPISRAVEEALEKDLQLPDRE